MATSRSNTEAVTRGRWRTRMAVVALTATTLLAASAAATAAPTPVLDALAGPAAAADLEVMTFNLRYASPDRPNSWVQRRPAMKELLTTERPHVIATQEGLAKQGWWLPTDQLREIGEDLGSRYARIGVGREGGNRGEHMTIFYNTDRLAAQQHQHFWLSDTPEVAGSNTWGGGSIRMVTWVRFLDKVTGGQFYVANTHLDNTSGYARERAARLIRERLAALRPALPIVLAGDFNSGAWAGSPVYDILVRDGGYVDSWPAAAVRGPVHGTFHNYQPLVPGGPRIDWVLTTPGVRVLATAINTYRSATGQFPSDHLPVQARLRLPVVTG